MIQQSLRVKPRDPSPFGTKGHKRDRHPRRDARFAVRLCIPHQHRPRHQAPRPRHRRDIGRRVRLAHGQCIRADQCIEKTPDAQLPDQCFRQTLWLIGADRRGKTPRAQPLDRRHRARVKPRLAADPFGIGRQKPGILRIDHRLCPLQPQAREPQPQHRPPAMKGRQRIPRAQHIAMPQVAKTGIGRRQKIGGCIG